MTTSTKTVGPDDAFELEGVDPASFDEPEPRPLPRSTRLASLLADVALDGDES